MTDPALRLTDFGGPPDAPLLIVGPSLGTSVTKLWAGSAKTLRNHLQVVGWDLPGHGHSAPALDAFTVAELAAAVWREIETLPGGSALHYAGDSLGGCVGLELALQIGDRLASLTALCTGARIGTPESWQARAELVRRSGTPSMVGPSSQRWFGPDFISRSPQSASDLLHALSNADDESYALACEALASFDVVGQLGQITLPVLAVAGDHDQPTPVDSLHQIATDVQQGSLEVLAGVAHLAPAEAPDAVAALILDHVGGFHERSGPADPDRGRPRQRWDGGPPGRLGRGSRRPSRGGHDPVHG